MIYEALQFLKLKLDSYLADGRSTAEPLITLSQPWTNNDHNKGASFLNAISLINIEEEKIFKTQVQPVTRTKDGLYTLREPDLKFNLFILISAYNKNYEDALKLISRVVAYFQINPFFENESGAESELPEGINHLTMELYTVAFEQQNQIWASLSTGYLPSVIYKVRMITVDAARESQAQKPVEHVIVRTRLAGVAELPTK